MNAYLISLCEEYISTVDATRSGLYTTDEVYTLNSQRVLLHDELCRYLGLDRSTDMYRRARAILMAAKGANLQ